MHVPPPQIANMYEVEGKMAQWIDAETWQKLYK